ncbi:uncharacterized protein LOC131931798 [Physella acuta]|uniref:uncharacterized protein LOC131931798 n=1 Tax=Physella acuta TaxID=109671 RepID=UPI0027DEA3D1|nr:uncharacterized protein LOC131931798 [Physella acuta]
MNIPVDSMSDLASTSSGSAEVTNMETECSGEPVHTPNDLKNLVNTYNNIHQAVEIKLGHVIYLWMKNTKKIVTTVKILEEIFKERQPESFSHNTKQLYNCVQRPCDSFKKFTVTRHWSQIVQFLETPFKLPQIRPKPVGVQEEVQVMQPEQEVVVEEGTKKLKTDCSKCALKRKSATILVQTNKKLKMQVKELKMELAANKVYKIKHLNQKIKRLTAQLERQKQIIAQFKTAHIKPTAQVAPPESSPTQSSPSNTSPSKSSSSKVCTPTVISIDRQRKLKIKSLNQAKRRNIETINSLKEKLEEKEWHYFTVIKQRMKQTNEMYDYLLLELDECQADIRNNMKENNIEERNVI